jgi:hypothetical protein
LKKPIYFISELEGSNIHLTGTIFTSGFNKASILKLEEFLKSYEITNNNSDVKEDITVDPYEEITDEELKELGEEAEVIFAD